MDFFYTLHFFVIHWLYLFLPSDILLFCNCCVDLRCDIISFIRLLLLSLVILAHFNLVLPLIVCCRLFLRIPCFREGIAHSFCAKLRLKSCCIMSSLTFLIILGIYHSFALKCITMTAFQNRKIILYQSLSVHETIWLLPVIYHIKINMVHFYIKIIIHVHRRTHQQWM